MPIGSNRLPQHLKSRDEIFDADLSALAELSDAKYEDASNNIENYLEETCGLDFSESDVDVDDIIQVIINWNQEGFNYADLDGDGLVNGKDLSMVLGAFGTCE